MLELRNLSLKRDTIVVLGLALSSVLSGAVQAQDAGDAPVLSGENYELIFPKGIGLTIHQAYSRLRANEAGQPVDFADPASFSIELLDGQVTLSPETMSVLMNAHVLDFGGASVRHVEIRSAPDELSLKGEMDRKGEWVPFTLSGPISLESGRYVLITAEKVTVAGLDAADLLGAGNVELSELLTLRAPGIELRGSVVRLDSLNMLPPPRLKFTVDTVSIDENGLTLNYKTDGLTLPEPVEANDSFMLISGGKVKLAGMTIDGGRFQAVSKQAGERLRYSLAGASEQIAAGSIEERGDGAIFAKLGEPAKDVSQ